MSNSQSLMDYEALVKRLRTEGRLSSINLPPFDTSVKRWIAADVLVDLQQVCKDALTAGATSIEVFADTVRVPANFDFMLTEDSNNIRVLSVVARNIKVESGSATLTLKYEPKNSTQPALRILVGNINGTFQIKSVGQAKLTEGKNLEPALLSAPLLFSRYSCGEDGLVQASSKLPLSMLDINQPLTQVLTASFDLAAEALSGNLDEISTNVEFSSAILKWLSRWAAYPSAYLSGLFQNAETLGRLLPIVGGTNPIYKVPQRSYSAYLNIIKAHVDVADKYELDDNFQDVKDDLKKVVGKVVTAWLERDNADADALDQEIKQAKDRATEVIQAVKEAAEQLDKQKFESQVSQIKLDTELQVEKIYKILKMTIDIVMAITQIAVGVATAAAGNPAGLANANPIALTKAVSQIDSSIIPLSAKAKILAEVLYNTPIALVEALLKDKDKTGKGLASIGAGIVSLVDAATILVKINNPLLNTGNFSVEEIGGIVSYATGITDPVKSKAAWDSFEVEAINQIDLLLNDPTTQAGVKKAAADLKTSVQKIAIYGRMHSQQQAMLAQRISELGILQIRRFALSQKRTTLEKLTQDLGNKDTAVKALSDFRNNRLHDLRRSFFVSLNSFRAAYFYETLIWPNLRLSIPRDVSEMKEHLLELARIQNNEPVFWGDFNQILTIKDTQIIEDLKTNQVAKLPINPNDKIFKSYNQVYLTKVTVLLEGSTPKDDVPISVVLQSEGSFHVRLSASKLYQFTSKSYRLVSQYRSQNEIVFISNVGDVLPTPFTTWTIQLENTSEEVDLTQLKSLTIKMSGKAVA